MPQVQELLDNTDLTGMTDGQIADLVTQVNRDMDVVNNMDSTKIHNTVPDSMIGTSDVADRLLRTRTLALSKVQSSMDSVREINSNLLVAQQSAEALRDTLRRSPRYEEPDLSVGTHAGTHQQRVQAVADRYSNPTRSVEPTLPADALDYNATSRAIASIDPTVEYMLGVTPNDKLFSLFDVNDPSNTPLLRDATSEQVLDFVRSNDDAVRTGAPKVEIPDDALGFQDTMRALDDAEVMLVVTPNEKLFDLYDADTGRLLVGNAHSGDILSYRAPTVETLYHGSRFDIDDISTTSGRQISNSRNPLGVGTYLSRNIDAAQRRALAAQPLDSVGGVPTGAPRLRTVDYQPTRPLDATIALPDSLRMKVLRIIRDSGMSSYDRFRNATSSRPLSEYWNALTQADPNMLPDKRFALENAIADLLTDEGYDAIEFGDTVNVLPSQRLPIADVSSQTLDEVTPTGMYAASVNDANYNTQLYGSNPVTNTLEVAAKSRYQNQVIHELQGMLADASRVADAAVGRLAAIDDELIRTVDDDTRQAVLRDSADNTRAADTQTSRQQQQGTDIKECSI
jgi:hypothetical protein